MTPSTHYTNLRNEVYNKQGTSRENWSQIALLTGPVMVVEAIVRETALEAQVELDWVYGAGFSHVLANTTDEAQIENIRKILSFKLPQQLP